jgi:hypothetical protein
MGLQDVLFELGKIQASVKILVAFTHRLVHNLLHKASIKLLKHEQFYQFDAYLQGDVI